LIDVKAAGEYYKTIRKLPEEFQKLPQIENDFKRRLYFVGILTKYLLLEGIRPVVVGGHAVEFYTLGAYTTGDLDIVCPEQEEIEHLLPAWGFQKVGRLWVNVEYDIELDIVSSSLKEAVSSRISEISVADLKVFLIGVEDLIIDRLNAAVFWKSEEDARWAEQFWKLHQQEIDQDYLIERAKEEGVVEILEKIKNEKI